MAPPPPRRRTGLCIWIAPRSWPPRLPTTISSSASSLTQRRWISSKRFASNASGGTQTSIAQTRTTLPGRRSCSRRSTRPTRCSATSKSAPCMILIGSPNAWTISFGGSTRSSRPGEARLRGRRPRSLAAEPPEAAPAAGAALEAARAEPTPTRMRTSRSTARAQTGLVLPGRSLRRTSGPSMAVAPRQIVSVRRMAGHRLQPAVWGLASRTGALHLHLLTLNTNSSSSSNNNNKSNSSSSSSSSKTNSHTRRRLAESLGNASSARTRRATAGITTMTWKSRLPLAFRATKRTTCFTLTTKTRMSPLTMKRRSLRNQASAIAVGGRRLEPSLRSRVTATSFTLNHAQASGNCKRPAMRRCLPWSRETAFKCSMFFGPIRAALFLSIGKGTKYDRNVSSNLDHWQQARSHFAAGPT
mmetsp:Transcript_13592/g.43413  ORF Transcript_13592/g.43413 Transcript_13592/m.43413 type:complete len:415 (-) Transcript_13592:1980-3224(-)